jgi:hypothetical protein
LLEKLSTPKLDEEIDEITDIGKKKWNIIEFNEITYTEPILLIDVMTSSGKVTFTFIDDARPRIIQMVMVLLPGRGSRINTNLFLCLEW